MSRILTRYVLRTYLGTLGAIFFGVLAIFLVADFVDRAKAYTGPHWAADAAVLYGFKALVAIRELAPAALLLAAGTSVSLLRKRGELTALSALTVGPSSIYLPIALAAALVAGSLVAFDDWVVVDAGRRADEITALRFDRWGDWRLYHAPQQWFRRGDRIFHLRGGSPEAGFDGVTVLRMTPDFRLAQRIDAERMIHLEGNRWRLEGVVDRTFEASGEIRLTQAPSADYDLGTTERPFRIQPGRPEQLHLHELREQIRARRAGGLSFSEYVLALHNRFAYPLAGLPAALLAAGFALRPGRKGHLTAALVEGLIVTVLLWGLMVICRTLVMTQRLSPAAGAWTPTLILVVAAGAVWLAREGKLGREGA